MAIAQRLQRKLQNGQGLVEFALVLPLVLLMMMGIIDFGRLFYMYSASSNAVREAVRIGATSPNDCQSISNAAKSQMAFVPPTAFNVVVSYDHGGGTEYGPCSIGQTLTFPPGDRVLVDLQGTFQPLTPVISSMFPTLPVRYKSARTITYSAIAALPPGPGPLPPPPPAPNVTIQCTPDTGRAPLTVTCTATNSGGTATSWSWTPEPSSGQGTETAVYTFANPGTYNVRIVVTGPGGVDDAAATITVNAGGPTANFSCDRYSVNTGETVTCVDQSDPNGGTPSGSWTWGDGSPAVTWAGVGSAVSHVYTTRGSYAVKLSLSDPTGASSATRIVNVYGAVSIDGVQCLPASGEAPLTVSCEGVGVAGDVMAYAWNWGDGSGSSSTYPGTHTFNTPGSYTVLLTLIGWGGSSDSATTTVLVSVSSLAANFTCTPLKGQVPMTVTCRDASSGTPTSWSWKFGDGGTSPTQNPTHTYTIPGVYTVTLTAYKGGASNQMVKPSYITAVDLKLVNAQLCATKNNNGDLFMRGTLTNTLKLPMTFETMKDTTANVGLDGYGNDRFCKKIGPGDSGDVHTGVATGIIGGTPVTATVSLTAINNLDACPVYCP